MLKIPLSKISRILAIFAALTAVSAADRPPSEASYMKAYEAWDTGDYVSALQGFDALLRGPNADRYFNHIALLTGELYEVTQLAPDGKNLRFSPDGRFVAFSTDSRAKQIIHILDAANGFKPVADINGYNEVFSPSGKSLAFLRLKDTPKMEGLREDLDAANAAASRDYLAIMNFSRELDYLEARLSEIVVRDLSTGRESVLPDGGLLKAEIAFSAAGRELYFVGAKESDTTSNDIYAVPIDPGASTAGPRALTSGPEFKVSPLAATGGKFLIYTMTARLPFQKPAVPSPPQSTLPQPGQAAQPQAIAGQTAQPSPASRPARGVAGQSRRFAVVDLANGSAKTFDGRSQAVSADGSAVLFIGREGAENTLNILRLGGDWVPMPIKKTQETINSAAFSPDGSRIAFEMTAAGNTEIFLIGTDGRGEVRLTHEVQNDRSPRFLSPKLVLAIKGEPRHSRAYLYDTETQVASRLFHNNTVRTLSFEYEWAPNPVGTKILIAGQRNGDTMVPEHGVYLLDLGKKITKDALLARIAGNLTLEKALRAKGEAIFKPIAAEVRAVTSTVSTTRVYAYEEAFFSFDSKHVTLPGNKLAAEYTFKTFESFGYKPEYQWLANRPVKTANVIAVLKGTESPDLFYVLGAHYDSVIQGPGADDDISAMAALLETARVLAGKPLPSSIIFAAFTGEESGLWGSREFARLGKEKGLKVMAGLNNDVVGWMNDNRLDNTIRYSNAAIRDIEHASAMKFTRLITYDTHYVKSTDAASLYEVWGDLMGGLGSYPLLGSPHYHQASDVLETVNHQLVTEVAKFNTAAVMLLASSPSPVKGLKVVKAGADGAEMSWTPNPEKGISHYVVTWGPEGKAPGGNRKVKEPRAIIKGLKVGTGEKWRVSVKAVNARGLASWDEAKVILDGPVPAVEKK
jgi:Tol biopolymer transport system component